MLADRRVIAEWKRHDEVVRVGRLGRGDDFGFARIGTADRDVVADRAAEQEYVLSDIGNLPTQRLARNRSDVLPVDQDGAIANIVEPQHEIEHGRLAAAGWTHQRRDLAGFGGERHVAQHRLALAVSEADIANVTRPCAQRERRQSVVGPLRVGGMSIISNRMRTPTRPVLSSMLSRAKRFAGS